MKGKKVLLIGWDAADWKVIDHLMEKGEMPTLKKMVEGGVRGNLSTLEPVLSPMLWTSIATGKYADKHGICGFTEPDYASGTIRPMSSISRKSRAIWNILTSQDLKSNVFSWWPSNPAEPINGIMISNLYQRANQPINKPWPMTKGTVHPKSLAKHFANSRVHPDELTEEHILPFIPKAASIDQEKDPRIAVFSRILADAASVHSASTWALENTDWDFTAIYHDAIDHACHAFMKFRAPQLKGMPDDMFDLYKEVVNGMYRFHDMMLERTLQLAGPDTNVILMSDHGFHSDHLRPLKLPKEPAAPAYEHRKHGVVCCFGPDFKAGETIYGSSILDITPTLLTLFGLPIGKDMDGSPLVQAFKETPTVKIIDTWETVEGNFGEHDKSLTLTQKDSSESVQQLVDLGYIDDPGENIQEALQKTGIELKYNLARVYQTTGRSSLALPIFEEINAFKPSNRIQMKMVQCLKKEGRLDEAFLMLQKVKSEDTDNQYKLSAELMSAELLKDKGDNQGALRILISLNEKTKGAFSVVKSLADCFVRLQNWKEAEKAYHACLKSDPQDSSSYKGIALCKLNKNEFEGAVENALIATELIYQDPSAHFILGSALHHLGEIELAVASLNVCLKMRPAYAAPRLLLEKIAKENTQVRHSFEGLLKVQNLDSKTLNSIADNQQKKGANSKGVMPRSKRQITIVSGLPRSGTSLMMQMLEAGGEEIFTDNERKPDVNNPNGFYEHKKVMGLAKSHGWIKQAENKVVKVVTPLLKYLPPTFDYKIIVMKRRVEEVTLSQHKMLLKVGKVKDETYPLKMEEALEKTYANSIEWLKNQQHISFIEVDFNEAIEKPENVAKKLEAFLEKKLDISKMIKKSDKTLYRNRNKN